MFDLFRSPNREISLVLSANVFAHVLFLKRFQRRKWLGALIGLAFGALCYFGTQEIFSTSGITVLTFNMVLAAFDILWLFLRIFSKRMARAFFRGWIRRGLAFLCAVLYCIYGLVNIRVVRETRYSFVNANLPGSLSVGLVSDAHLGTAIFADKLAGKIEKMISAGADIVVLAGDIVDESTDKNEFLDFARMLESVRAPKGIYFVFGNHDASPLEGSITRLEMETAFAKAGVTVLTDESILLDGWLRIVGREDASKSRMEAEALLVGADADKEFILMIDHQPVETEKCALMGVDLMLSGHTHAGQVFPLNVLDRIFKFYEIGYGHKKIGDMHAVVSSGVAGLASAFRTAGRSEYVIIEIKNYE